jgi:hypothetical protein
MGIEMVRAFEDIVSPKRKVKSFEEIVAGAPASTQKTGVMPLVIKNNFITPTSFDESNVISITKVADPDLIKGPAIEQELNERKGYRKALRHGWERAKLGVKKTAGGAMQLMGEHKMQPGISQMSLLAPGAPAQLIGSPMIENSRLSDEELQQTALAGQQLVAAVKEELAAHPEWELQLEKKDFKVEEMPMQLRPFIPGGAYPSSFEIEQMAGVLDTTIQAIRKPEIIVQSTVESAPLILEGVVGEAAGGPPGAFAAMFGPMVADYYGDNRYEGVPPDAALAMSLLQAGGEAAIETWTFERKLGLFKDALKRPAGQMAKKRLSSLVAQKALKIGKEGAKAYGRGFTEEFTQTVNRNLWEMVFANPPDDMQDFMVRLFDGATQDAIIGGFSEMTMAGGFGAAGKSINMTGRVVGKLRYNTTRDEKSARIDKIEQMMTENADEESAQEIKTVLNEVREQVNNGEYDTAVTEQISPKDRKAPEKTTEQAATTPIPEPTAAKTGGKTENAAQTTPEGVTGQIKKKYSHVPSEDAYKTFQGAKKSAVQAEKHLGKSMNVLFNPEQKVYLVQSADYPGPYNFGDIVTEAVSEPPTQAQPQAEAKQPWEKRRNFAETVFAKPTEQYGLQSSSDGIFLTQTYEFLDGHKEFIPVSKLSGEAADLIEQAEIEQEKGNRKKAFELRKTATNKAIQEYKGEKWADEAIAQQGTTPPAAAQGGKAAGEGLKDLGPVQGSIGATKSPALDRALQRAAKMRQTSYVVQRQGKWINTKTPPPYGDYYEMGEKTGLRKGKSLFDTDAEAIKAAQYIAKNTDNPIYIKDTAKGFELSTEEPKGDFVKVNPKGPGLTKEERALLATPQRIAEAEILQEEGAKIGYKSGQAEGIRTAKENLNQFRLAIQLTDKHRQDALGIVKQYVPTKHQYRYTKRILNASTNKRIDDLTNAVFKYIERAEKRQAVRNFRNFIQETKSKYSGGGIPLGKLRNDVRNKLLDTLAKYDTAKLTEAKKEQLESRDEYIRNVAGTVADAFESLEESGKDILQMPNARIEELNRLRKQFIGENLDTEQIRYIHSSLDHLIKISEQKGLIKKRIRAERVGKLVNQARAEVHQQTKTLGIIKEKQGFFGFTQQLLGTKQATPRTLVGFITGKDNTASVELVTGNLRGMTKERHRITKDFVIALRNMLDKAGVTPKDTASLADKIDITYGGKTFRATKDELLSVYLDTQAEGNLNSILKTGRVFEIYERDPKTLFIKTHKQIHTGRPSLEELRRIVDYIENKEPALKKLADVYFEHNFKVQTPVVNKASMEHQNYELFREKKHWHLSRIMPSDVGAGRTDISISINNQGRFLPKTGGKQPLRVIPFSQELIANLQANAAYASMTIPMEDIKALVGDERWQQSVIKNGHGRELKTLITLLRRIQGQRTDRDFIELAGAKVLSSFGKYALSLRLSGYGVQTASIPAAFETIEPKHFLKARPVANLPRIPVKGVQEMMDLSPTLWMRWTARQFDFVIGGAAAQNAFDNLIWGDTGITDKLLNHYTWGDEKAIYQIYLAAQEKVASETSLERGTTEFKKKVIEIVEEALETQPMWDAIHRNELTSSQNVILRGSLMFQSARAAQYNVLLRAGDDYRKGRIGAGEAGKRVSGVVTANLLVAVIKKLVKAAVKFGWLGLLFGFGDEDKKEKVKIAAADTLKKDAMLIPVDTILNLISLPAFGEVPVNITNEVMKRVRYPNMQYRLRDVRTGNIFADLTLDVAGIAGDTAELTANALTGEKYESGKNEGEPKWKNSALKTADGIAELIAMRTGLPYSAPKGEIYFQIKSAERATEEAMTIKELKTEIWKNTLDGSHHRPYSSMKAKKGQEEKVEKLKKELNKRESKN